MDSPADVRCLAQRPPGIWAGRLVWGVWGALVLAILVMVHLYAVEPPFGEDWPVTVPLLTGEEHFTFKFFWKQNNEHRIVLPKLIDGCLALLTHGCFKAENYANAVLLSLMAAWLLATAKRLRGRHSFADALIPLLILHPAYSEIWTIRMTMDHTLSAALICAALILIVTHGGLSRARAVMWAVLLICLPLSNANGLPVALACGLWMAWLWLRERTSPDEVGRREARRALLLAVLSMLMTALYFVGYTTPGNQLPASGLQAIILTAGQALSLSLVPWTTESGKLPLLIVPVVLLLCSAMLCWAWFRQPQERPRVLGLLLFLAAMSGLAAAIGWGRAGLGELAGTSPRYGLVLMPTIVACYLAIVLFGRAKLAEFALLTAAVCVLPARFEQGLASVKEMHHRGELFMIDMKNRAPAGYLFQRHAVDIFVANKRRGPALERTLERLRKARIGPFAEWRKPPRSTRISFPPTPSAIYQITWDGATAVSQGSDPSLTFSLDHPRRVLGIEIRFILEKDDGAATATMEGFWARDGINEFVAEERTARFCISKDPEEQTLLIWINDTVDRFRIDPDMAPCRFTLREITLLEPEARPPAAQ